MKKALSLFFVLCVSLASAIAQTSTGRLVGTVTSSDGVISGAMHWVVTSCAYLADQLWNPSTIFNINGETLRHFHLAIEVKSRGACVH